MMKAMNEPMTFFEIGMGFTGQAASSSKLEVAICLDSALPKYLYRLLLSPRRDEQIVNQRTLCPSRNSSRFQVVDKRGRQLRVSNSRDGNEPTPGMRRARTHHCCANKKPQ
jgi:hypothetical protein